MPEYGRIQQAGAILPLVILLLTLMTATALAVARTATANTRLVTSVQASKVAFRMASGATHVALQTVRDNPAMLPGAGHIELGLIQHAEGRAQTRIRILGTSTGCPELGALPAERSDYEIQVTANSTQGALKHHRQGFYVCRETCTPPCVGVETPARQTYWYQTRPDKP